MTGRAHAAYLWVFLLILAPIGAAVLIAALLLFGVRPHAVFAPGWAVKALFELCGLHVANRVAVASTGLFWWAVIAAIGLAWEWRRKRRAPANVAKRR